jgi:hypothetical protein
MSMNKNTQVGLSILAAALLLGVAGDGLLRTERVGINLALWIAALVGAALIVARGRGLELVGEGRWLVLPALFYALSFAWRDSATLQLLNGIALVLVLALWALRLRSGTLRLAGILDYLLAVLGLYLHTMAGAFALVFEEVQWKEVPRGRWSNSSLAVLRGLGIALPLLLVFGALFVSADAVFQKLVIRMFDWDFDALATHSCAVVGFAIVAAGLLHMALLGKASWSSIQGRESGEALGLVELGTALGLLNLLFFAFVLVQFRYFFGGAARVQVTADLTYAEYARRGFFELVTVTALVLPVLLLTHWLLRKEQSVAGRLYRGLSGLLVAQLFVIMASALQRMRLYQEAYGLTELRLYTTGFMAWLGVVILWFVATVLRGQRRRFAFGALVSALAAVAILNRFNPDDFIVRINVARLQAGRPFDPTYVTGLSADAVPSLVAAMSAMTYSQREMAAKAVLARWSPPPRQDWREWNWSRSRAWQVVGSEQGPLKGGAGLAQLPTPTVQVAGVPSVPTKSSEARPPSSQARTVQYNAFRGGRR